MAAVIHYRIGDERSEEILDELERLRTARSMRLPGGKRACFLVNESPADLVRLLERIDPNWSEHVEQLTR
jgi:hypothetical protein